MNYNEGIDRNIYTYFYYRKDMKSMRELMLTSNEEVRITSVELVEIINEFRKLESETIGKDYKELRHDSFMTKIKTEVEMLEKLGIKGELNFKESSYINCRNKEYPCYILDSQAVKFILDSCRTRDKIPIAEIFNKMSNGQEMSICTTRPEYEFIDGMINALKPFGINDYKTQYYVCNKYRIDLYIPSLNIAIEFDENGHKNYPYKSHKGRQKEIEEELGCKFIRVSDENNLFYNIGYVIKEIMDSLKLRSQYNK